MLHADRAGSTPRIRRARSVRGVWCVGAALLLTGLGAQGAVAQIASGYSGSSDGGVSYMGNEETWQALRVFGACYARGPEALQLIATVPGTPTEREAIRQAIRSPRNCFGYVSRVQAPFVLMRGAVAEGLWKRGVQIPADLQQAPPPSGAESRNVRESARCFAAAHGDQVRALLATALGSRREGAEADAIMSGPLKQCMPAGVPALALPASYLRYFLVEALLRLPITTPPAGQR